MPKIDKVEDNKIKELLGDKLFVVWSELKSAIESKYDMTEEWHTADKGKAYELKCRRGGKTLVSLFPNFPENNTIGVMIIFGKDEREKFEAEKDFSDYVVNTYEEAKTFHDGKWIMFQAPNKDLENDLLELLLIKRKPNKK